MRKLKRREFWVLGEKKMMGWTFGKLGNVGIGMWVLMGFIEVDEES